jgi:hypothetical protein
MDFNEWKQIGFDNNWIGPAVCSTHDGIPMTREEDEEFIEGADPCVHVFRLYESTDEKLEVEANHSASVWRQ